MRGCGWSRSPPVVRPAQASAFERGNWLRSHEYDETTWSARTWPVFAAQRVSCALTRAVALEVARELSLSTARDTRDDYRRLARRRGLHTRARE